MSMMYAGTKALKRDVTRFGKRTNQGAREYTIPHPCRSCILTHPHPHSTHTALPIPMPHSTHTYITHILEMI